jgi:aquaporin Z
MAASARDQRGRQQRQHEDAPLARIVMAELLGTFFKTFVAAGGAVLAVASGGQVGEAARAAATGLMVMALSYALGEISGAHNNPAITLAFAARGAFPWHKVPLYWAAQLAGALAAALLLRALFGLAAHLGATEPHAGIGTALGTEVTFTFLLAIVVLGTATRHRVVGPNAAIASGGTVALATLIAGPVSGASLNPASSLGPALVAWHLANAWLYLVGPLGGALLAALASWAVYGAYHDDEEEAAAEGEAGRHTG